MRERLAFGALALAAVLAWALVPTYPDYDAYHHLVWGRDLLDGVAPGFEDYAAPTQHPLYLALGALLSLAGEFGDRLLVLVTILSLVALTAGTYALGKALFNSAVGAAGAAFVGSSFAFALYAVRAFVDVPFLALVIWAAALEARRPRRGMAPMVLLAAAGLLRPEAWVLAGLYWLWCLPGRDLRERAALAALVATAPVLWALVDLAVTGDPLFSLHSTSDLAASLGRERGLRNVPANFVVFLADLARPPVAAAGAVGLALAVRRFGARRMAIPLALVGTGVIAFVAIGIAGLSLIPRYLTLPAVALCVLAGYAVAVGVAFLALKASSFGRLYDELRFIDRTHDELGGLLAEPRVRAGMRCGALTFPTYRLVPDARWQLRAGADAVRTRAGGRSRGAIAVYITGDEKFERRFGRADGVSGATNRLPAGSTTVARGPFAAYDVCGARAR